MKGKALWSVIIALVITNCLTIAYFVTNDKDGFKTLEVTKPIISNDEQGEAIATIGNINITRQQWLNEIEDRYGEQTLKDMIDETVVREMSKKYDISITDEVLDREIKLIKTMYNSLDNENIDDAKWREQIELSLLLESLLTKDVVIPDDEIEKFYQENKELYEIPKSYRLSHIIVNTSEEAEQVRKELEEGSSFSALAMEKSLDEFSANRGGELGFVSAESDFVPESYLKQAKSMKPNEWSVPIKTDEGYAVIFLHEVIEEVSYTYDEVKDQIKRQIAIEQMNGSISVEPFWDELGVSWFYGDKK